MDYLGYQDFLVRNLQPLFSTKFTAMIKGQEIRDNFKLLKLIKIIKFYFCSTYTRSVKRTILGNIFLCFEG